MGSPWAHFPRSQNPGSLKEVLYQTGTSHMVHSRPSLHRLSWLAAVRVPALSSVCNSPLPSLAHWQLPQAVSWWAEVVRGLPEALKP